MLHAEVRCLDELVTIGVPGIRAEPVLEAAQHRNDLPKLAARSVGVIVKRPEVERQPPPFAVQRIAEMRIAARVDRDVIVVDRTRDEPFVRRRAVYGFGRAAQPPVRYVDQRIRYRNRDALAVGLVGQIVLVGPPDARTQTLVGGCEPQTAQAVGWKREPAIPGQPPADARLAVIPHGDRSRLAGALPRAQRHEEGVAVAPERRLPPVLDDAVYLERHLEVDLHLPCGRRL